MKNELSIYCDGGARGNPGPAAAAFVVKDHSGKTIGSYGYFLGEATNNQAEYQAVIKSLEWVNGHYPDSQITVNYFIDSLLVVNQIKGLYKIKNAELRNLILVVRQLDNSLKRKISYHHIPREKNWQADALVNQTIDKALHSIKA